MSVSRAVRLVVATHWHDDHVSGLAGIVDACTSAVFACSSALLKEEFLTLIEAYSAPLLGSDTGVSEFDRVLEVLQRTGRDVKEASVGKALWQQDASWAPDGFPCEIRALAPSDAAVKASRKTLVGFVSDLGQRRRIPAFSKNEAGVVLIVRAGGVSFLLGDDLEETHGGGWSAMFSDTSVPRVESMVFKMPHHGSKTGHCDRVWAELLQPQPYAMTSPLILGRNRIPTRDDVKRISGHTQKAYITASPQARSPRRKRSPSVDKTIKENLPDLREVFCSTGQVRLRMIPDDPASVEVELFEGAIPLSGAWK